MNSKRSLWGTCALLVVVTLAVYWPVFRHSFINYDDQDYLTQNLNVQAGLTWKGVAWAFTTNHAGNWHPITWLSHMMDCQLFGMYAGGHHLTNVLFHMANVILLFLLLRRMTLATWQSAVVAALFAVHPLHVESVAWASERKDVLSTFFFLLTLWAYEQYARRPQPGRTRAGWYAASLGLFALSLMSKPMLVTLPFILLLLDYWPLGRLAISEADIAAGLGRNRQGWSVLLLEKVPFLALSILSSVVTMIVQRRAMSSIELLALDTRVENVIASYLLYIVKLAWPTHMSPFYPFPAERSFGLVFFAATAILVISAAAIAFLRRLPYLAVGWFWYFGTLVPVIGIVQVGLQSMADRYTYIPSIGLFIAQAWCIRELVTQWQHRSLIVGVASVAVVAAMLVVAAIQVRYWRDSETLFRHSLKVTKENPVAHHCLGCVLVEQGKIDEAAGHFAETVRLKPAHDEARNNLGLALVIKGKIDEAITHYQIVLEQHPKFEKTHYNLGRALEMKGRREEALGHYEKAVELLPSYVEARADFARLLGEMGKSEEALRQFLLLLQARPNDADTHFNAATLLAQRGDIAEAVGHYEVVLRLKPEDAEAHERLGLLLAQKSQLPEALAHFNEVARLRPDAQAYYNLALGHVMKGDTRTAVGNYRKALKYRPDWPLALNDLAWILATDSDPALRDGAEAVRLAERACELTKRQEARFLGTLDAAYAEAGRFEEAIATAQKARELALAASQASVVAAADQRLKLYESKVPYHQSR